MPLGKLSKRQIQSAYSILNEVQQVSMKEMLEQEGKLEQEGNSEVVLGLVWGGC